jgi:hypothetical protein
MSEMFREFNRVLKQKQKATLSYRPQANGQQERSNKTVIQTIKMYIEDAHQKDWDIIVGRIMFAVNNSHDHIRGDTPHYLIHGWDAKTTLEATIPSPEDRVVRNAKLQEKASKSERGQKTPNSVRGQKTPNSGGGQKNETSPAAFWRERVQQDYERAMGYALKSQQAEKEKRANSHNMRRRMKEDEDGQMVEEEIKEGDLVWLYINKVKTGYKKKLAHLWHGPFRVKKRITSFSVELELPAEEGYRFYPRIHIARLKLKKSFPERPKEVICVPEEARLDFDESLVPEDREVATDEFEVEEILDEKLKKKTRQGRQEKLFLVKWKGYAEPTWEPEDNLSCQALLEEYRKMKIKKARLDAMHLADQD